MRRYTLLILLLLCLSGFTLYELMGPGIDNPTAVGAYLNGAFPDTPPSPPSGFKTENAFPNITFNSPFKVIKDPRGDRFFVAEKRGRISLFSTANGGSNYETVVDIQDIVSQGGGTHGLMGFVLHPEFGQPGSPNRNYFYLFYRYIPDGTPLTTETNSYRRLSRFELTEGSNVAQRSSELVMIQQFVRSRIHSGGGMVFDKNGFLFIGLGDAGNCCEQYSTQRLDKWLLGGILRIDVDEKGGNISHPIRRQPVNYEDSATKFPDGWEDSYSQGYYIPNANPWQDRSGGTLEEFYALGIRHAYTLMYDAQKDELWEGEIGQSTWEEINKIKKGHNYEWPFLEAVKVHRSTLEFTPKNINEVTGIRQGPHVRLNRATSNSVIGGLVYRGSKFPALRGKLLFADHRSGTIYSIDANSEGDMTQDDIDKVAVLPGSSGGFGIASFATDEAGEIYIVKLNGVNYDPEKETRGGGTIHKLVPDLSDLKVPTKLSETNAFANLETLIPSAGIIPYTVNSPLWSDGASKKRWIALPNNGAHDSPAEKIVFDDDQPWQFPEGTVLIKHFELPVDASKPNLSRRLETRFIIIGKNEQHYGLTYRWRTNHKEADLVIDGVEVKVSVKDKNGKTSTQNWSIPSSSDCLTCHTDNAGKVLGVNTHQLNGNFTYPASGVSSNQLETWSHLGMFNTSLADPTDYLSSVPLTAQNATTNHKIFSYLDANCGHCHHPTGVEGAFDARFHLSYDARKLINQAVDGPNSTVGGVVVKPGKPNESELFIRDNLVGGIAMPPLAKELIDEPYIAQLRNWINEQKEPAGFDRIGEAGFVMVDHSWKKVNLRKSYTKPVVIAGGVSNRGGQAAFARVRNVTPNSFEVKVEEWACMDKRHLVEQINYLVVEAGRHELTNGKILEAGILDEVNHEWTTENFSEAFSSVPVVMAQIVSNEQEGVNIRLNHSQVNANRLSLKIQNAEKGGLSKEKVGWIAVEKGSQKTGFAFESGTFRNVNSNWKHLTFSLSYTYKPLFVGFIGTYRGGDPASLRFEEDKLTGNGVKVYVQEDQCLDTEVVHTNEHINFLVFERAGFLHGKSQVSEKKDQTINFAAIPDKQVGDAAFNLTASASSGLGVTFSIESGPATVSGRKVSLTGKSGTVRIKASQAGNVNWKPAEAIRTFKVTAAPTPSDCEGTGIITLDIWKNVPGMEIADIPLNRNPSTTSTLSIFEIDPDMDDEYASRIRGYVCPPASGNYTFWIASDDHGELWLSTDDNPSNKRKIANVVGWTPYRTWDFRTGQESSTIRLEAGQKYYIEALHKEGGGGDNLSVGWQLPSGTMERPIPGNRLLPMSASSAQQGFVPLEENLQVSAQSISIYPNPASGMIYLNWEGIEASPESYYVHICDLSGKCVVEKKLAAQGAQLDVSQLAKGIYQVMVEAGEYRQVSRVLILD